MIAASLFFSLMGAIVKQVSEKIPAMEAVFFRAVVSLAILTPWMIRKRIPLAGTNRPILLLRSLSGFTALALSFYVISKIKLADAAILNHTSVLFVALVSVIFLREKVSAALAFYTLAALVGAAFIVKPGFDVMNVPGLMGLASGFFAAIAYLSISNLHKTDSFFTMVFYFSLVSSIGSFALFGNDFVLPHGPQWAALIGLGVVGTIAQLLMTSAYKHTEASVVSPFSFASVLFSATWGLFFWQEIPDLWSIFGGIVIIASGVGIIRLRRKKGGRPIGPDRDYAEAAET